MSAISFLYYLKVHIGITQTTKPENVCQINNAGQFKQTAAIHSSCSLKTKRTGPFRCFPESPANWSTLWAAYSFTKVGWGRQMCQVFCSFISYFSCCCNQTPNKKLSEERSALAHSLRVQATVVGRVWWQEIRLLATLQSHSGGRDKALVLSFFLLFIQSRILAHAMVVSRVRMVLPTTHLIQTPPHTYAVLFSWLL